MICLDMKSLIELRELLGYADCGWSFYTHIPVQLINEVELEGSIAGTFAGDSPEYDYIRMYYTIMIDRCIKQLAHNDNELYRKATALFCDRSLKILQDVEDPIMF